MADRVTKYNAGSNIPPLIPITKEVGMKQYSIEELRKMTKDDLIAVIKTAQEEDAFRKTRTREQGKKYRNRAKEKQSALEAEVARLRALTGEAPKQ